MTIIKKRGLIALTIMLSIVCCLVFTLPCFFRSQTQQAIRQINVDEIGTLSYEDRLDQINKQFSKIETEINGEIGTFCGEIDFSTFDHLSTADENSEIKQVYETTFDGETETIEMKGELIVNDKSESTEKIVLTTKTDEETGDLLVVDQNGNIINLTQEGENQNFDECFCTVAIFGVAAIVALLFVGSAALYSSTTATQHSGPSIVDTLVQGVRDGVKSLVEIIKLAFGAVTAKMLVIPVELTDATAEDVYKAGKNRKDCYLLCGTVTGNSPIVIKSKFTNYENARNWIKKGGSVWSPTSKTAQKCIEGAGYKPGGKDKSTNSYVPYVAERHEIFQTSSTGKIKVPSFYHYHTLNKRTHKRVNNSVHSFYWLPLIG